MSERDAVLLYYYAKWCGCFQVMKVTETLRSYVEHSDRESGVFQPTSVIFGNTYVPDMRYIIQALLPEVPVICLVASHRLHAAYQLLKSTTYSLCLKIELPSCL